MKQPLFSISGILIYLALFSSCVMSSDIHAESDHDHHNSHSHSEEHHHRTISIPDNQPAPSVDLIIHQDSIKGWNLEIQVSNFRFAPENVNQASNYQEGHAHLYINGQKITRLYGSWYYLSELKSGHNEIKVALNANGHEALIYNGQIVEDIEIIEVPQNRE